MYKYFYRMIFRIMCRDNKCIPRKLYMYFRIENAVKFLEHHQVKFSRPFMFNDPYECHIDFDRSMDAFEGNISRKARFSALDIAEMQARWFEKFKDMRIACFTEEETNVLMWAYYAEGQKGICIEFDTDKDPLFFENLYQVKYKDSIATAKLTDEEVNYRNVVLTKSTEWRHENEWRVIRDDVADGLCTINPQAITSIIFGSKSADFRGREALLPVYNQLFQILQRPEYGHIKLSGIECSPREYKLVCNDIPFYVLQENSHTLTLISLIENLCLTILKKNQENGSYEQFYQQQNAHKFEEITVLLLSGIYCIQSDKTDMGITLQITND